MSSGRKPTNPIRRQITTTEENILRLLGQLETDENTNVEFANVQNKMDKLFVKLSDNHNVLTTDVKQMLDNLRKGTISPDALEEILVVEKEKVSYSVGLADEAKKSIEDVMKFVQHFISDVEKGKPMPKESFKSLYHELDGLSESMNTLAKVHRTKDITRLRKNLENHMHEKKLVESDDSVVSLNQIIAEYNRQRKDREKRDEKHNSGQRKTCLKTLARPPSQQNLLECQSRLSSPEHDIGPPALRRTGTASSMGNSSTPLSPGAFGNTSFDEGDFEELGLHGVRSSLQPNTKVKVSGRQSKRISSSVIYPHTMQQDLNPTTPSRVGTQSANILSISQFVPEEPNKMFVSQCVQTDYVIIVDDDEENDNDDAAEEGKPPAGSKSTSKKNTGGKRKLVSSAKKDGRNSPVVSSRRGSRDVKRKNVSEQNSVSSTKTNRPQSSSDAAKTKGKGSSPSPRSYQKPVESKKEATHAVEQKQLQEQAQGSGGKVEVDHSSGNKEREEASDRTASTKEYFLNYLDKPSENLSNNPSPRKRSGEDQYVSPQEEEQKLAKMAPEQMIKFLGKKEQKLILLESQLNKKQESIAALIESRVAEEVKIIKSREIPSSQMSRSGSISENRSRNIANESIPKGVSRATVIGMNRFPSNSSGSSLRLDSGENIGTEERRGKPPSGRQMFAKAESKEKPYDVAGPPSINNVIEKILSFLPTTKDSSGKFAMKVPVKNLVMSPSMDDSTSVKLPPIMKPSNEISNGKDLPRVRKKRSSGPEHAHVLADPSTLEISGTNARIPMSDDEVSESSSLSQDSVVQRLCQTPVTLDSNNLVNEIWIPPPTNITKPIFNTICIFPLHTHDQATSTDDIDSILELPLAMETIKTEDGQQPNTSTSNDFPEQRSSSPKSSAQNSPTTVPRGLSHVEAISRPSTRGETVVISRPVSRAQVKTGNESRANTAQGPTLNDVAERLKSEPETNNPLLKLYLYFYKDLNVQCRHHLLAAASGVSMDAAKYAKKKGIDFSEGAPYSVASLQGMSDMFEVVAEEVSKLEYTSYHAMAALQQSESIVEDLALIAATRQELSDSFYSHLKETSKKLGEIKMAVSWVDMLLQDSRAIFSRTRTLGIDPVLIGPQFSIAYQAFLSCQGRNLSLKQSLDKTLDVFNKYLSKPMLQVENTPVVDNRRLERRCEQLQERCEELEEAIDDIKEENEELQDELRVMDSQLDRTPAALLFYSVLHTPNLPEIVSQHVQVLLSLKSTLDGKDHFDFISLKRRLEQSLHGVPAMQQFLKKFNVLHKKWSTSRARMFSNRRQIGADADNHYVCPICNIDSRKADMDMGSPLVQAPVKDSSGNPGLMTKIKSRKRLPSSTVVM